MENLETLNLEETITNFERYLKFWKGKGHEEHEVFLQDCLNKMYENKTPTNQLAHKTPVNRSNT